MNYGPSHAHSNPPFSSTNLPRHPVPRVVGSALSGNAALRKKRSETPILAPPCTANPETSHAALTVTKDGSGNPVLSWSGTGPYDLTRSTSPGFTYQVDTLAQSTSSTSYTDTNAPNSSLVCYDVSDEGVGEVSEAVWGLGYIPPTPPEVDSVSPFGAWVGDTVTLSGSNFDPIALENQVMWNQIPAAVVNDGSNTTTSLKVIIPKGATQASVSLCAYQACSPVDTSNPNAVIEVATTTFTDIGSMAFDDAATGGDHKLRVADRGTSAIYSVDPEVKGAPAITTLASSVSQPTIPTFCLSDGSVLYTSEAGGTPSDTIYTLSRGGGTPTTYATTRDAQTNTCHGISPQTGVTPRAIAVNPNSSGYAYIADNTSYYIRRILQGTTLSTTSSSAIDPTYGGLYLGALGNPCPQTTDPISSGEVDIINASGGYYAAGSVACPSYNYAYCCNLGSSVTALTLNEVYTTSWINYTPGQALAFAQEASTHYGFLANAFSNEITRLPDPDIQIEPSMPTKVLISNKLTAIPYPSTNQSADAQIRIDITASVPNTTVYLRVIDPADLAPYVQPVSCASVTGCDCGIQGQMCDNKEPYANWGFGAGRTKTASVSVDGNGKASIILYTTTRYAGDNYQVQASYQALNAAAPFSNAHIKASSGIITAWKRVFVERDRMFRHGGLLFSDFNKDTCSPCNQILLYDWTDVADGNTIVVFDEMITAEAGGEVRTVQGAPHDNGDGSVTVTLSANLTKNYYKSSQDTSTPPKPTFSNGHSGAVGTLTGDPEVINATGARFYDPDMRDIAQPFNDAYVEFFAPRSGMNALPFLPQAFFDTIANILPIRRFHKLWFTNCLAGGDGLCGANNYFHSIGASFSPTDWGISWADSNVLFSFIGSISNTPGATYRSCQYVHDHETGHNFGVNPCWPGCSGHDENLAWCDDLNHCLLGGPAQQHCLMFPGTLAQFEDGVNRFCTTDLLDGIGAQCTVPAGSCGQGYPPTDVTHYPPEGSIRQDVDPQ